MIGVGSEERFGEIHIQPILADVLPLLIRGDWYAPRYLVYFSILMGKITSKINTMVECLFPPGGTP